MTATPVTRDERTVAVENAGYRWAYLALSYGILLSVAWRAFARGESSPDLLALVVGAGVVTTAYGARHRVLTRRWALLSAGAVAIALGLAVVLRTMVVAAHAAGAVGGYR